MKNNKLNNYIIFWLSQAVSQLGSSMTSFALVIWAYKQTNSALSVSLMSFCWYLPYIGVSIFVGSFIDRHNKKNIMLCSDFLAALTTIFVLLTMIADSFKIHYIYIVNIINGIMGAFQSPAESVAIGIIVPEDSYAKTSGLESLSNSLITVVTPMLAAFIISTLGLYSVIAIDLISFLFAFIILLFFVRIPENIRKTVKKSEKRLQGLKEGLDFLSNHKGIWYLMISMALLNFLSRLTYENILSPMILARSGGNNYALSLVTGILGISGIAGGLVVSAKTFTNNNLKLIYFSAGFSFLFGDLLMGIGQSTIVWSIAAIAASMPIPFIGAGQNVILYHLIPKELQGKVFSVRNAIQYSTIPVGILLGGYLADYVFEPFIASNTALATILQSIVGVGTGSGMAVMFLCTGLLGFSSSIFWYNNKEIQKLQKK